MWRALAVAIALVSLPACLGSDATGVPPTPEGPPVIQYEVVRQHAEQFNVDVPDRPPGSQHETAAASYILGHLQLAGYSPRLDRVPVENTLNSTNVVAMPPNGSDPEFLIAVPYDTPLVGGHFQSGREIGLFLELARSLTVADPDHSVAFAALGAETDDNRGTRRLAQFLLDEEIEPSVILFRFREPTFESQMLVQGSCAGPNDISPYSSTLTDGDCTEWSTADNAITGAGFELTYVDGDIEELGRGLFEFLIDHQS
ncbi:MAG: hypothetical protein QOG16_583 [Actinomycetota bacterium]|nr:hypothetical protein [Actinomycetota bacterium]